MNEISVIQYGLGPIGRMITRCLLERPKIRIVGAIDIDPALAGKDLGEVAELGKDLGVPVSSDASQVLSSSPSGVVILTTGSSLSKVAPQIEQILAKGHAVVSTCEELSYPWKTQPDLARRIDQVARQHNVAVLGTGVNPGFLMDFLPLAVTALCTEVKSIRVGRVQDASKRRLPFQQKIGAGLDTDQFDARLKDGSLRHVGLTESIHMIAARLGWEVERIDERIVPVIAGAPVASAEIQVSPGQVAGIEQLGDGIIDGEARIRLYMRMSLQESESYESIEINGSPYLKSVMPDGVHGDMATTAVVINAIPVILRAEPGLRTMADLPPVSYWE
ncbi:MAG TPA: dihydrodipicolinate reductase [bacterium]|nr:dihydrodipicolinate reductase [bacterium]